MPVPLRGFEPASAGDPTRPTENDTMKITIELYPNRNTSDAVHAALLNLITVARRDAVEFPFGDGRVTEFPVPEGLPVEHKHFDDDDDEPIRAGGTSSDDDEPQAPAPVAAYEDRDGYRYLLGSQALREAFARGDAMEYTSPAVVEGYGSVVGTAESGGWIRCPLDVDLALAWMGDGWGFRCKLPAVEVRVEANVAVESVTLAEPPAKGQEVRISVGNLLAEIPRAEVRLKVGDRVKNRADEEGVVHDIDDDLAGMDNVYVKLDDDGGDRAHYLDGRYYETSSSVCDIVEVNGARIVDEEAP